MKGATPETLRVALDDIVVDLEAPPSVATFVRARYSVGAEASPDIVSRLRMRSRSLPLAGVGGRRVRVAGDAVWCRGLPGLHELSVGVRRSVPPQILLDFARSPARRAYKAVVAGIRANQVLESLSEYAVLYPALVAAERRGRYPLHASAVVAGGRAVVLLGLPGAGKSTLSAALQARGLAVLSDNLITVGAEGVWSVPEPVKLDARSHRLIGIDHSTSLAATYGRSARPLSPLPGPLPVAAIVHLVAGATTQVATADDLSAERLLDLNRLAYELHAYYYYRAFVRLGLSGGGQPSELAVLGALLAAAPAVTLTIGRDDVTQACAAVQDLV